MISSNQERKKNNMGLVKRKRFKCSKIDFSKPIKDIVPTITDYEQVKKYMWITLIPITPLIKI